MTNSEFLADVVKLAELRMNYLNEKTGRKNAKDIIRKKIEKLADSIDKKVSLFDSVKLPAKKLLYGKKISKTERQIIFLLLAKEVSDELIRAKLTGYRILCAVFSNKVEAIAAVSCIKSLIKYRLIKCCNSRYERISEGNLFSSSYTLTSTAREKLLGIKHTASGKSHNKKTAKKTIKNLLKKYSGPKAIFNELSKYVVGQSEAKHMLSIAVFNHLNRILLTEKGRRAQKSNVLMLGPTGVGKTYLIQTIARIMNLPISLVDITKYTGSGWVGKNVCEMFNDLIRSASKNKALAEIGIVYIDEIDKIAQCASFSSRHGGKIRDISGEEVQKELLRVVEGDNVTMNVSRFGSNDNINTENILFIGGGAFSDMKSITAKNKAVNRIGFTAEYNSASAQSGDPLKLYDKVTPQHIIDYGFLPEFVGRFPVIVPFDDLSEEELSFAITEPEDSILKQMKETYGHYFDFELTDDAIQAISVFAKKQGIGARALRGIFERILSNFVRSSFEEEKRDKILIGIEDIEKILV